MNGKISLTPPTFRPQAEIQKLEEPNTIHYFPGCSKLVVFPGLLSDSCIIQAKMAQKEHKPIVAHRGGKNRAVIGAPQLLREMVYYRTTQNGPFSCTRYRNLLKIYFSIP
jgi:hypothetical protein